MGEAKRSEDMRPCNICTSVQDRAHPSHICTGTYVCVGGGGGTFVR